MNQRLDLRQAEHDVHSLVGEMDRAIDARKNIERPRKRLMDLQRVLQKHLGNWEGNHSILANDIARGTEASAHIRKGRDGAQRDIQTIRNLLEIVAAALARARRSENSVAGGDSTSQAKTIELRGIRGGDLGPAAVTFETVPLLDMYRYGAMTSQIVLNYPAPQLGGGGIVAGAATLHEKIISGLGLRVDDGVWSFQIEMPDFSRLLFRGGSVQSNGMYGVDDR